jgi:hypothetical protein
MGSATSETEQVSQLIGDIYDAALDAGLWRRSQRSASLPTLRGRMIIIEIFERTQSRGRSR